METYKKSPYRWVVIAAAIPVIIAVEVFWLTFSPVSSLAQAFYGVDSVSIDLLAMSYMIMYIALTFPASWVVDKFGFRSSLTIGSLLVAVFGVLRAVFASNFIVVLICQFMLAAAQPFLINISTRAPANWFPVQERATAAGLLTMAQYIGFVIPMVLSPILAVDAGGIPRMLWYYAIFAVACAAIAIIFTRERPAQPAGPDEAEENLSLASMVRLFKNKNFILVLIVAFISTGIFNTLLTLVESILTPRGISIDQAGLVGGIFVIAGVIGAVVLPMISDKLRVRIWFFVAGMILLAPLYLGITLISSFAWLLVAAGAAGFIIMGLAPILFQHGAEVAYPAKEGTSYGLILLMGQVSGVLFVLLFEALGGADMTLPMIIAVVLTALEIPLAAMMKESKTLLEARGKGK